ncbi:MAG: SDR family NAD(P)-dependent oxidoreductase [Acidimicrobiia bacterium]|nr:SDR family NAD(P)-dependent oxidoreductase [Acidimicrobiia bacterium]
MGLLDDKVAIVTGAGRGVGRGEALELAAEGARLVVNDAGAAVDGSGGDKAPADEVVDLVRARGGEAVASYDDVSDWEGAARLVATAVDAFGALDVLVNNAGILRDKMIVGMTEEQFDSVIAVHLKGTFACTHHAASYWRSQSKAGAPRRAAIVNTVSSAGLVGNVGQANYGAAKAGIAALTVISSLELQQYGVRANAVAPGGATRMSSGVVAGRAEVKNPEDYDDGEFERLNPANSAPMVAWLASDAALHVTGQVFKAVGDEISLYRPWHVEASVKAPKGPRRWKPAEISNAVNTHLFGTRNGGLTLGGGA